MKKLLTLIAFTTALVPTVYGMESNVSTNSQTSTLQAHDELVAFIQTADSENFKNKFDTLALTPEQRTALRQVVAETKEVITKEIGAMGDSNKNWLEIAKGGLAGAYGLSSAISAAISIYMWTTDNDNFEIENPILEKFLIPSTFSIELPIYTLLNYVAFDKIDMSQKLYDRLYYGLPATAFSLTAYKSLQYATKKLKLGFNYKEHLQTMLANLDTIDAHIAQAKI